MNMPVFNAEASLYHTNNHYRFAARGGSFLSKGNTLIPQTHLYPPVYSHCLWLSFCCTEYDDPSCCEEFWATCRLL
jgi:hypothetical protein